MKIAVSILMLCGLISCTSESRDDAVRLSDHIMDKHYITSSNEKVIREAAAFFLNGTSWEGKVNINGRFNRQAVNFYLIDGSAQVVIDDQALENVIGNCAYIGSNTIIADVAYLETFLDAHRVFRDRIKTNDFLYDQDCFAYWVIGHELGHMICGHLKGEFIARPLDIFVKTSSLDNQQELQADSFFVANLLRDKKIRQSSERLMIDILNAEIFRKTGNTTAGTGILYDYTNKKLVEYARQPSHPEYVIRLARMLELSTSMAGDSGMYLLVEGFIKNLRPSERSAPP